MASKSSAPYHSDDNRRSRRQITDSSDEQVATDFANTATRRPPVTNTMDLDAPLHTTPATAYASEGDASVVP